MPRPFGWSDQFCIDELMRRYEDIERRIEALESRKTLSLKNSGARSPKPTAQGMRASGDKK